MPVEGFTLDLTTIWAFLIALAVLIYVILDGFDLGLGMLFALERKRGDRDVMMNSVAPVWDGNETWLVLALIFRGVAFEFRWRTERGRWAWDIAFIAGSGIAALSQGITLGGLLQGIRIDKAARAYSGGWWDWLTPFSLTVGVAVMVGYMLLGATWLVMKTGGPLQERMRARAWPLGAVTLAFIGIVSLWTPFLQDGYYNRWFADWRIALAGGVAAAVLAIAALMFRSLTIHRHEYRPFVLALMLFVLCFVGLGISMFPYITDGRAPFPPVATADLVRGDLDAVDHRAGDCRLRHSPDDPVGRVQVNFRYSLV